MKAISPNDTASLVMGTGALSYVWWFVDDVTGVDLVNGCDDDWSVTVRECDPDDGPFGPPRVITHAVMVRAVRRIVTGGVGEMDGQSITRRECRALVFKGADETDFDSVTADNVLQIAAFGELIYV